MSIARKNLIACQELLVAFHAMGLEHIVLCPGSRSGPLALAAGELANRGLLKLVSCIDERSAAFLALGISTANGKAVVVITTSGSAVANLLPAAIEADRSTQPILFLTADRPIRLKNCGSNQTVNQEEFLRPACRSFEQGPNAGIHHLPADEIYALVSKCWQKAHCFPGPVHLNLPIEEPLHASLIEQKEVFKLSLKGSFKFKKGNIPNFHDLPCKDSLFSLPSLDPSSPGVVVVGPWRGKSENLAAFQVALRKWQSICGWPVFADPLSGVSFDQPGLISNWDLLLCSGLSIPKKDMQVLRLGPMPSSRNLEDWLLSIGKVQVLITEGDYRNLDPLGLSSQWSGGFVSWLEKLEAQFLLSLNIDKTESTRLLNLCLQKDQIAKDWLDKKLVLHGVISEPVLAHWLPNLLPSGIPVMLAASSPVRDWLSYGGKESLQRRCFGFRGASGIDGTLSLGMGLSMALGPTILITGDLALLHDSNGWLFSQSQKPPLVVLVIDNGGGGIFKQINLETESNDSFQRLFAMPQTIDILSLAKSHGIPYRQVSCLEDLQLALDWSLSMSGPVLLRVCTNPVLDADMRREIRMLFSKHLQFDYQKNSQLNEING
ncbi:2-succinyl-5-enolpyruvyl-6-hydroxy-3-cyclohexene-1-carboxylic-acid synthase [Prochlorococcus sp. MIT 1307]|uniref:2-succinyl-5-enolpyruvyl-6-hydroxy-3- cyclohexene-1-carboxylic-acid synthase n=1 Tax=Prochlorococcus sp. MIT 1307 TaxID=3096219 RepID=UPI0039BFBBE6